MNVISPPASTQQANKAGIQLLTFAGKFQPAEVAAKSAARDYPAVDVYEEDTDSEEDTIKFTSPVVLFILFSFLFHTFSLKANHLFDLIKCALHPKKYLALSVLRI